MVGMAEENPNPTARARVVVRMPHARAASGDDERAATSPGKGQVSTDEGQVRARGEGACVSVRV